MKLLLRMLLQSHMSDLKKILMSFLGGCECHTPQMLQGITNDIWLLRETSRQQFQK